MGYWNHARHVIFCSRDKLCHPPCLENLPARCIQWPQYNPILHMCLDETCQMCSQDRCSIIAHYSSLRQDQRRHSILLHTLSLICINEQINERKKLQILLGAEPVTIRNLFDGRMYTISMITIITSVTYQHVAVVGCLAADLTCQLHYGHQILISYS